MVDYMPIYSNSKLNKFEDCPRAYKFKYIEDVEVEIRQNIYGFLGSRVHEALEKFHKDLKNGRKNSLNELIDIYLELWEDNWSEDIEVTHPRYDPEHFKKVGERCIKNYYEKHGPFVRDGTVATELRVHPTVEVKEKDYNFQGLIDRLSINKEGEYIIHDYKTGKNLPSKGTLRGNRQLPLYQIGVQQKYPDADNVELVWHYVRFGKDFRFKLNKKDLNNIKNDVVSTIQDIEKAKEEDNFPTMRKNGASCNWCDYQKLCPAWKHLHSKGQT